MNRHGFILNQLERHHEAFELAEATLELADQFFAAESDFLTGLNQIFNTRYQLLISAQRLGDAAKYLDDVTPFYAAYDKICQLKPPALMQTSSNRSLAWVIRNEAIFLAKADRWEAATDALSRILDPNRYAAENPKRFLTAAHSTAIVLQLLITDGREPGAGFESLVQQCIVWLESAADAQQLEHWEFLETNSAWKPLYDQPRFHDLLERLRTQDDQQ
jgi:tetratricopeptide (TPR) repeat protein